MTVLGHALKPRHDIGKQRACAVPARIVRVPERDEPGKLSFSAMPGRRNYKIGAKVVRHGRYVAIVRRATR